MRTSIKIEKPSKPRGRPRAYDRDGVIDEALKVFWRNGFSSTSLDDLVEATGINRPSLYAGFGDKENLYRLALDRFRCAMKARLDDALISRGETDTIANAVKRYFTDVVDVYLGHADEAKGCPVFCTTVSETSNHEAVREMLAETLESLDKMFEAYLYQAHQMGQVRSDLDCVSIARLLVAAQHSLALRARAGQSREELEKTVEAAVRLVS
jgi:AcrR family transcriptional regulator